MYGNDSKERQKMRDELEKTILISNDLVHDWSPIFGYVGPLLNHLLTTPYQGNFSRIRF